MKIFLFFVISCVLFACGDTTDETASDVDEWGRPILDATGGTELSPGKDDLVTGSRGLPLSVDSADTAVWEVKNAWEDTDTANAREAGVAWGEDSGLNWDEKYQAWVSSFEKIDATTGYSSQETFLMPTPWGNKIAAPTLECAEVAIFLRVAFASWYNLPFFLEARDREGRIYFGHFGMRRASGAYGNLPRFKTRYADYTDQYQAGDEWPTDASLLGKKIPGSFDDEQPQLGDGKHAGDYFDTIFLNKRTAHFLILTLVWFGSVNLADSVNTYNLKPEHVGAGDVLLERWGTSGIGHTLVVMNVADVTRPESDLELEVELASGSMPRRQPVWDDSGTSKRSFTLDESGGKGHGKFGGGLKRWRVAADIGGRWTNIVLEGDTSKWINSNDIDALEARQEQYETLLTELTPEGKRDVLLSIIESRRQHLQNFPASCSARTARENAFTELYSLSADEFGQSAEEVDSEYRILEDYVFAELEYQKSKTCCWNQSTAKMYDVIMDYAQQEQAEQCVEPTIFMNRDDGGDGFEMYREHAESLNIEWRPWTADESCPWQDLAEATPVESDLLYCE